MFKWTVFLVVLSVLPSAALAQNSTCEICSLANTATLDLGSLPGGLTCAFINLMFCSPMLFVVILFIVGVVAMMLKRRRGR